MHAWLTSISTLTLLLSLFPRSRSLEMRSMQLGPFSLGSFTFFSFFFFLSFSVESSFFSSPSLSSICSFSGVSPLFSTCSNKNYETHMKWNLTNLSRSDLPDAVGLCIFQPQKKMTHEMMAINILITSFSTRFEMEVRVRWRKGRKIKFFMGSKKRILVLQLFFGKKNLRRLREACWIRWGYFWIRSWNQTLSTKMKAV